MSDGVMYKGNGNGQVIHIGLKLNQIMRSD